MLNTISWEILDYSSQGTCEPGLLFSVWCLTVSGWSEGRSVYRLLLCSSIFQTLVGPEYSCRLQRLLGSSNVAA